MARAASTYRAARRNAVLRPQIGPKRVWPSGQLLDPLRYQEAMLRANDKRPGFLKWSRILK